MDRAARRLIALVAAAMCLLSGSCTNDNSAASQVDDEPQAPPYEPLTPPPERLLGVCLDGSSSVTEGAWSAVIDDLAELVRRWPSADTDSTVAGVDPIPALVVIVRQVSMDSFGSLDDQLLSVTVPGVPGLAAEPDPSDRVAFVQRIEVWAEAEATVRDAAARAEVARGQLLEELGLIQLESDGSEIVGCVTEVKDSFPADREVVVVIASDLAQNGEPQLRGDYAAARLLVSHYCSDGESCLSSESEWRSVFEQLRVAELRVIAPQRLTSELADMLDVTL